MGLERINKMLVSRDPLKIVAFGDSFTYGWMVSRGYIDFLREMLSEKYPGCVVSILNRGIPGDTAENGLHRITAHVLDEDPDLVLIQFGLNDAYMGYSPESFSRNISSIVGRIRNDTGSEILLMTSNFLFSENENRMAQEFYRVLMNIADLENVAISLVHEYWKERVRDGVDHRSLVQADLVHPTVAGHLLIAEAVMKVLQAPASEK